MALGLERWVASQLHPDASTIALCRRAGRLSHAGPVVATSSPGTRSRARSSARSKEAAEMAEDRSEEDGADRRELMHDYAGSL